MSTQWKGSVQALEGLRVIDLATVVAGPGTAKYLADFGADVIKVERPGGDSTRGMGWVEDGESDSLFWKLVNRGKRTITLDLKSTEGLDVLCDLLRTADVLIENMRPGKLEALGLTPDRIADLNPRLVTLRVSGFGQSGPYSQRPGFATLAEALSGYAALSGDPDGAPLLPPIALTDEITALVGAFSVLVALRHTAQTSEGQVIDVNLLESLFQVMGPLPSAYAQLGYLQPRLGSGIPYTVPRGTYRCSDGRWVALSASSESVAQRVLSILGVAAEERFADFQSRAEHREDLERLMRDWIEERPYEQVLEVFRRADAAIAPVYTMEDIFVDPHFSERGVVTTIDGLPMQNVVARMSRTPGRIRHVGPGLNAHAAEILAELSQSPED